MRVETLGYQKHKKATDKSVAFFVLENLIVHNLNKLYYNTLY